MFDLSRSDQQASRMSRMRQTPAAALVAAALVVVAGCGKSAPAAAPTPTPLPISTTAAGATLTPVTPTATPTPSVKPSKVACPAVGPIPDGRWVGPLTMRVTSRSGGKGFASSQGSGTLRVVVTDGRVSSARWSLHWISRGQVDTGQAAASILLPTSLTGTGHGSALRPALTAIWTIRGTATITKPVHESIPFTDTGSVSGALRITALTCTTVSGSFPVSFTSKDAQAAFSGTARWAATH